MIIVCNIGTNFANLGLVKVVYNWAMYVCYLLASLFTSGLLLSSWLFPKCYKLVYNTLKICSDNDHACFIEGMFYNIFVFQFLTGWIAFQKCICFKFLNKSLEIQWDGSIIKKTDHHKPKEGAEEGSCEEVPQNASW